ncbi:hypothetical protein QBK99_18330 [Corticibacterium sp. UT-5YL-CI-8]|nr:hypothetical protein [Tianweitania sp. UT-5YL-CI-8]
MMTNTSDRAMQTTGDSAISALFSRAREGVSIVDQLMDMPAAADNDSVSPEWNTAVARRLEGKLVNAMRAVLDKKDAGVTVITRTAC